MYDAAITNKSSKLVVQWEGKKYKEDYEKTEQLATLVTGLDTNKFLAAAKLNDRSGEEQAKAVLKYLDKDNSYSARVVGMCFNTTRSNTGAQKGVCAHIEKALGKDLFHFARRHHVFELILKAVLVAMLN